MSTEAVELPAEGDVAKEPVKYYSFSVLLSGFARMWRAWRVSLVVVIVNALLQAAFIIPSTQAIFIPSFIASVVMSALVLLASAACVTAASLDSVTGKATWASVMHRIRPRIGRFALWTTGLAVVVVIGQAFGGWPGLVVAALLPFLLLGVMAGERNPIAANFTVILKRPFRWAITLVLIGVVAFFAWIFMAGWWFFVPGVLGAATSCLLGGLLTWWWSTSLACIYRSVRDGETAAAHGPGAE